MNRSSGLTEAHVHQIQTLLSAQKTSSNQKLRAYVFGSRARGDHRPFSDVDLLIEGKPPLADKQLTALKEAFEESNLPFKFDLLTPEKIFQDYRAAIEAEKQVLLDWF